jgi:hypothetical protein
MYAFSKGRDSWRTPYAHSCSKAMLPLVSHNSELASSNEVILSIIELDYREFPLSHNFIPTAPSLYGQDTFSMLDVSHPILRPLGSLL